MNNKRDWKHQSIIQIIIPWLTFSIDLTFQNTSSISVLKSHFSSLTVRGGTTRWSATIEPRCNGGPVMVEFRREVARTLWRNSDIWFSDGKPFLVVVGSSFKNILHFFTKFLIIWNLSNATVINKSSEKENQRIIWLTN
jgi:hypothetical protein